MKNQARWVAQFLADMALLHAHTGDSHFSVILVDFESEDMDVEQALRAARLPRYRRPALPPPGGTWHRFPPGEVCFPAPRDPYLFPRPQVPIPEENRKF